MDYLPRFVILFHWLSMFAGSILSSGFLYWIFENEIVFSSPLSIRNVFSKITLFLEVKSLESASSVLWYSPAKRCFPWGFRDFFFVTSNIYRRQIPLLFDVWIRHQTWVINSNQWMALRVLFIFKLENLSYSAKVLDLVFSSEKLVNSW